MATFASDTGGGKDFDPVPEGSHIAICDMFVDLGMQDSNFGAKHKIYIRWQIPSLRMKWEKDGVEHEGPMAIGGQYTLSLSEKSNLRPMLQSWRGKAFTPDELKRFDVASILGAPCMLSVVHKPKEGGGVYANVGSVMKLPQGVPVPQIEGELLIYDDDNRDSFDKLRPWIQEKLKAAIAQRETEGHDFSRGQEGHIPGYDDDMSDSIPF